MAENNSLSFIEESNPDAVTIDAIFKGLKSYNASFAGPDNMQPLWLVGRDANETIQAGLKGTSFYNWLFIDWLWIAESFRGKDYGSSLLSQAEAIAKKRGCIGVFLDTYSFQAPHFYAKHGYKEIGRLLNLPPGHHRVWMQKLID